MSVLKGEAKYGLDLVYSLTELDDLSPRQFVPSRTVISLQDAAESLERLVWIFPVFQEVVLDLKSFVACKCDYGDPVIMHALLFHAPIMAQNIECQSVGQDQCTARLKSSKSLGRQKKFGTES